MLNIFQEKGSCNCGLYCAIFLNRQHQNASVISQQIVTSSSACFLREFSVCINSWRLLLHDLSLSGPGVWWSCRHLLLLGHHLCWSHVHPGLHRDPAGEINNLCALWVCWIPDSKTQVSVWHSSTCHVKDALNAKTNALKLKIMTYNTALHIIFFCYIYTNHCSISDVVHVCAIVQN